MRKQYEETMTQKVVCLIVEIAFTVILLGGALIFSYITGNLFYLFLIVPLVIEFFRKDDQKSPFKSSKIETSPYEGELVSYQEYPKNANGVNGRQGFDKYRDNITEMEDICSDITK